jgi:hypothetical protein
VFKIKHWSTKEIETVYATQEKEYAYSGKHTEFLIHTGVEWLWVDSENYEPYVE